MRTNTVLGVQPPNRRLGAARPRTLRWFVASAFGALATLALERAARADDPSSCVDAYERAQEQRLQGSLIEARNLFASCATAACPAFIHEDCSRFVQAVNVEVPSASFEITSDGGHLTEVRVSEGQRVLAERLDETALELNPGSHWLRFESPGTEPVTQSFVIARGEKNRVIRVELPPLVRPPPAAQDTAREQAPATGTDALNPLPYALLGIGAAGVTGFGLLALSGRSDEAHLAETCAPNCSAGKLKAVDTKYLLADVSLAVGVTSILAGGYLLFTQDSASVASSRTIPFMVHVGPSGGSAVVRSDF
jgi:hypothetical protein